MSTTDQMLAESRKKSLLQYVSEGANDADLEAAGYTPAEIAAAFPPTKPVVTSKEFDRDRQAAPNRSTLEAYNPTFRDNLRENVRRGVSALGVSDQTAQFYAGRMAGTGGDMGLVDVTGLGVIPQVQEGIQQAERGYKTGNKTEMAMGALGAGLGVLSAIPGGTVIAKGISKGTEKLAEAAVRNYDPALLRTVGTPTDKTAEALGEIPKGVKPKGPKVATPYYKVDNSKTIHKKPDEKFGIQTISEYFNLDRNTPELQTLGYTASISLDELAKVKLGRATIPDIIDYNGADPTPEAIAFVENHLARLDNNPAFVDYTNKLKDNPAFNPWEEFVNKPETTTTVFRSPILEVVDQIEFPKKGIEGYQLLSELKNSPSVRKAEFDTVTTAIDPKARYTKEEAKGLLEKDAWKVTSREYNDYRGTQRQVDMLDPETDYFERAVTAEREGPTFKATGQHFDPSTLAHSRASVREDAKGPYTLVEESQTDLLQHGFKDPVPAKAPESVADAIERDRAELLSLGRDEAAVDLAKLMAFYEEFYKIDPKNIPKEASKKRDEVVRDFVSHLPGEWKGSSLGGAYVSKEDFIKEATSGEMWDAFSKAKVVYRNHFDKRPSEVTRLVEDIYYPVREVTDMRGSKGISQPPIKNIEESIKLVLDDLIAASAERGVTRIVMPPLDRVVSKRFRVGSPGYEKAMDPKSGFSKTYVSGFKKVLGDYQKKLGAEDFKVSPIEMNYSKSDDYSNLSRVGTEIDFSGLVNKGYDLTKPHFAEGGSVEKEQMDKLMQEGGIAGSAVTQEPVTGNEVPPGAMPSEVRDDISAQLSEGEYVVPADVVRFFGVKFFEDLRSQAKQGLAEMQSNGRIGGAAVDDNGIPMEQEDEELTPEEEQMLQNALGQTGMAEGGFVPFDRTTFTLDSPVSSETRKYIDPKTGETKEFKFLYGAPLETIPANYVPWTQELADAAAKPATPTTPLAGTTPSREKDSKPLAPATNANTQAGDGISYNNWAEKNYEAITADPYTFGINALKDETGKNLSKGLTIAGAVTANPLLAGAGAITKASNKMQNIAEANAALHLMEAKGLANSDQYNSLKGAIDVAVKSLPGVQQFAVEHDMAATGNQYLKSIAKISETKTDGKVTAAAPTIKIQPTESSKSSDKKDTNVGYGAGKVDPGLAKAAAAVKPTPAPATVDKKKETAKVSSTLEKTKQGLKVGGFEQGGLVTRTTKTAPKTKGLAGKQ
jgi:hypothetical protein